MSQPGPPPPDQPGPPRWQQPDQPAAPGWQAEQPAAPGWQPDQQVTPGWPQAPAADPWASPTAPEAQGGPAIPPGPAIPQAPSQYTAAAPTTPLGQSPYGEHSAPDPAAQQSYGQFTFPVMKRQPLEPTAVAAVATSPLGPVGLILGLFARRRVRTKHTRSMPLANTGAALGALFTVVWVLVAVVLVGNGTVARWTEQPEPGDVAEARTVGASNVAVGNCIQFLPPSPSVGELPLVPCAQEHAAQAISEHDVDGGGFPGTEALETQARSTCQADVSALAAEAPVIVWYLTPSAEAWDQGTQRIVCLARGQSGALTGDLVNG